MSRWESALLLQHSEQYHERGFLRGGDGSSLAIPDLGSSGATEKSIDIEKHHDRMVAFGWCHGSSRRRSEAISDQKTSLPVVTPGSSVLCTRGSTPTITSSGPQIGAYTSQFLVLVKKNGKKKEKKRKTEPSRTACGMLAGAARFPASDSGNVRTGPAYGFLVPKDHR